MSVSFRRLLPSLQVALTIVLLTLWFYTVRQLASSIQPNPLSSEMTFRYSPTDGVSYDRFARVDSFASYWSIDTNLPALPILALLYQLLSGHTYLIHVFNTAWRITAFGLAGTGIWFFVGRFVDDVLAATRGRLSPRRRTLDVLFFVFVVVSSFLVLACSQLLSPMLYFDGAALRISSIFWLAAGGTALLFETRWERRRRTVATAH
jgi:hypothetical protein